MPSISSYGLDRGPDIKHPPLSDLVKMHIDLISQIRLLINPHHLDADIHKLLRLWDKLSAVDDKKKYIQNLTFSAA